jgi:hypothetical protein
LRKRKGVVVDDSLLIGCIIKEIGKKTKNFEATHVGLFDNVFYFGYLRLWLIPRSQPPVASLDLSHPTFPLFPFQTLQSPCWNNPLKMALSKAPPTTPIASRSPSSDLNTGSKHNQSFTKKWTLPGDRVLALGF